jgi:hypothetical protein
MEAIYLLCGVRRPQLKRDPLGCTFLNIVSRYTTTEGPGSPERRDVCFGAPVSSSYQRSWGERWGCGREGAHGEEVHQYSCGQVQPNMRMKLAACGRRLRQNAQWRPSILSAAPAGRSLCAIR